MKEKSSIQKPELVKLIRTRNMRKRTVKAREEQIVMNTRKSELEDKRAQALRANLKRRKKPKRDKPDALGQSEQGHTGDHNKDKTQETHDNE